MKSTTGSSSSAKSKIPAIVPIFPLYINFKISPDSGAQMKAKGGNTDGVIPIKSKIIPKYNLIFLVVFEAWAAFIDFVLYIAF